MPNLFETAVDVLNRSVAAVAGVSVVYTPRGGTAKTITATPSPMVTDVQYEDGTVRTHRSVDFVVSASDLTATPVSGDSIVWSGRKFTVSHPAGGDVYDSVGTGSTVWKIHTKEVYAG